jgi:hypothetical protein
MMRMTMFNGNLRKKKRKNMIILNVTQNKLKWKLGEWKTLINVLKQWIEKFRKKKRKNLIKIKLACQVI